MPSRQLPYSSSEVAAWRGGAKHYPVFAQVTVPDQHWPKAEAPKTPRINTQQLITDLRMPQPPPALQAFRDGVLQGIQQADWENLTALEQGILVVSQEHYPPPAPEGRAPKAGDMQLANCARKMWALFRALRAHPFTAQGVFTAWRQWAQFSRAHKEHKQRAKAKSKAKKSDLLHKAQEAATQGNMHQAWMVVKALAPKKQAQTTSVAQGRAHHDPRGRAQLDHR